MNCPKCESSHVVGHGRRRLASGIKIKTYKCKDCDYRFTPQAESANEYTETQKINSDGTRESDRLIELSEQDSKSPEMLLKAHGFDPTEWEIVSAVNNLWHGQVAKSSRLLLHYQSKIVVRPIRQKELTLEDIDNFFKSFSSASKSIIIKPTQFQPSGDILEIDLADVHVGNDNDEALTWKLNELVRDICARCVGRKFSKIVLVQMGDIFHFDNQNRTTLGGTNITTPISFSAMWDRGAELMVSLVDVLQQIAPVELVNIYGNHDRSSSYTLSKALEFYYRNTKNVKIDAGHSPRKWRVFGVSLVYFVHGDLVKANLHSLVQREARKEFGDTKYAEIHVGHFHHEHSLEKDGVIIRYLPTPTSPDEWHYEQGYTGQKQAVQSFVWGLDSGLREIWYTNL